MNAVMVWFGIGALLILAELFTPAFIIVFFGLGAWGAALTAAFWPGLEQELVVFVVVSLASILLLRRKLMVTFKGSQSASAPQGMDGNPNPFPYIGHEALVTQSIPAGGIGEISLGGSFWRATATVAIAPKSRVRVVRPTSDDALMLIVEAL